MSDYGTTAPGAKRMLITRTNAPTLNPEYRAGYSLLYRARKSRKLNRSSVGIDNEEWRGARWRSRRSLKHEAHHLHISREAARSAGRNQRHAGPVSRHHRDLTVVSFGNVRF